MNYLAHILLSGPDPQWQLGGYLGDFVKGPLNSNRLDRTGQPWSARELAGIALHRRIDAWIDEQPLFMACVACLGPKYRRVGGIAMDVMFDHLLARHWDQYVHQALSEPQSLQSFSRNFYALCLDQRDRLPERAELFISRAAEHDLFRGYARPELVMGVLERIEQRLRFGTNLVQAGEVMMTEYDNIERLFFELMPVLLAFAAEQRRVNA
ncbi:DUF479 domain-containing protein [Pseudomaricurvus alkylphenolicus]|uniref:ACP phosphodiesterase n=1 Tax=Pseudomaricurvus alkylphenolicus TaxID=1306991 RepID=UPI00142491C4|nr:DUF479 domain-containing protein [Pseudomaricurvus alkylphenolicus]